MYVLGISPRKFLEKYRNLSWGSRNKRLVFESLERLRDCTWTYFYVTKKFTTVKILFDFQEEDGKWYFWVNTKYIDAAKKKKEFLRVIMNFVSRCKTDVGKLLVLWLQGQKNTSFKEEVIAQALHVQCVTKEKTRQQLKKAFDDAVQAGYLINYTVEKRANGFYFVWTPKKVQVIKGYLYLAPSVVRRSS